MLITRVFSKDLNKFFTTSFSLLSNKKQNTYYDIFSTIKNNILSYDIKNNYSPKEFHCNFEISLSNAFKSIFPATNIKYICGILIEIWKLIKIKYVIKM